MIDWDSLEKIAQTSSYELPVDRLMYLEKNWNEFAEEEYKEIVKKIYDNQLDPISYGFNYGQKDIIKHLNKLE